MTGKSAIVDVASRWINVGDVKLKFTTNYNDLESCNIEKAIHFAACPFGGPIALAFTENSKWYVHIRTLGGRVLVDLLQVADVFALEWTRGHRLLVVSRQGKVNVFSSIGEGVDEFHFSSSLRELRDSRLFNTSRDTGFAVLDEQLRLFVVNSVSEPVVWHTTCPQKEVPTTWTAVQPHSQLTRVIIVHARNFYVGSQGEAPKIMDTPWALSDGQYARIANSGVSDSYPMRLALYHSSRKIQIVSVDLTQELSRITVPGEYSIYRFGWIGLKSVFLQRTPNHVQFFNCDDETAVYDFPSEFVNIAIECDGIRLVMDRNVQLVSIVSQSESSVLGVASSADGALLHEASQWLDGPNCHQAYEYAMQIANMPTAIEQCISCAAETWSTTLQKSLMKAARFGMAFSNQTCDSSHLVNTLRKLRVLNEIRSKRTGMAITAAQLDQLGETSLLHRLIDMSLYGVAIETWKCLARDCNEGIDRVLMEWVRRTVRVAAAQKYDNGRIEELSEKITDKLSQFPHVSLADAAKLAIDVDLPHLARLLIKREVDDSKQVSVLLRLNDIEEALKRAAAAQKPQLMHQVVRHLITSGRRAEFELSIRKIPLAQCLYQEMVRREGDRDAGDRKMLALLEQSDDFERQIIFHLDSYERNQNPVERLNALKRAKESAKCMGDKSIEELIGDMVSLAPGQSERNEERLTIRQTVIAHANDAHKVAQLKQQAKLSDKQVFLWTIEGLVKSNKLEQLYDLSQKKSPIGYVPFIEALVKYNKMEECKKYFPKVTGYQDLVAAYLLMGNYVSAAKLAFDRRDEATLQRIWMKSHKKKEAYAKVGELVRAVHS